MKPGHGKEHVAERSESEKVVTGAKEELEGLARPQKQKLSWTDSS
jgi:hypothetical protein